MYSKLLLFAFALLCGFPLCIVKEPFCILNNFLKL